MRTYTTPENSYQSLSWDRASVFPTDEAWESEREAIGNEIPMLGKFAGTLSSSASQLLAFLDSFSELGARLNRMSLYAQMHHDENTTLPLGLSQNERAQRIQSEFRAVTAFFVPELLNIDEKLLTAWYEELPSLKVYQHSITRKRRLRAHILSPEVENALAVLHSSLLNHFGVYRMLNESETDFDDIIISGETLKVNNGNIDTLLSSPVAEVRERAWMSYIGFYNRFSRTYSECFAGEVRTRTTLAKLRGYASALDGAMTSAALPVEVFDNMISTVREHYSVWHRYWEIKRRALGLDYLKHSDVFAPLAKNEVKLSYPQACETIIEAMAPLGPEYVSVISAGFRTERWVDIQPRPGKRSNAYSSGEMGTKPFILTNWDDSFREFSTLAHELGHSMHSYFTCKSQPWINSQADLFTAEVASNFNQAMVRQHLLQTETDPTIRLQVLEEAFYNLHRYLFWMPVLSQFERASTESVESGGALTAPWLKQRMTELLREAYGPAVKISEEEVGMSWASYIHLYLNFYAFQYGTGIAAAYSLSKPIVDGDIAARDRYLEFLSSGGSDFSLNLLKRAGVDLSTPKPIKDTFVILSSYLDEYEKLIFG